MSDLIVATTPDQMTAAKARLVTWANARAEAEAAEALDLWASHKIGLEGGVKVGGLYRLAKQHERRALYYNNLKAVFEAGYVMVPNFPITVFAIRTDREEPTGSDMRETHWSLSNLRQEARALPLGDGKMVSPWPLVHDREGPGPEGKKVYLRDAEEFQAVSLPAEIRQPSILEPTVEAMRSKLFHEIGICTDRSAPGATGRRDPIVIGRILLRHGLKVERAASFFVAWWLDLRRM